MKLDCPHCRKHLKVSDKIVAREVASLAGDKRQAYLATLVTTLGLATALAVLAGVILANGQKARLKRQISLADASETALRADLEQVQQLVAREQSNFDSEYKLLREQLGDISEQKERSSGLEEVQQQVARKQRKSPDRENESLQEERDDSRGGREQISLEPTQTIELPEDYAFLPLTKGDQSVDVTAEISGRLSIKIQARGKEAFFEARRDSVRGLRGKGLTIEQQGDGNILNGTYRMHFIWTPEPIACYRDGQLLGIWDSASKLLRAAKPGEAQQEIQYPDTENSLVRGERFPPLGRR